MMKIYPISAVVITTMLLGTTHLTHAAIPPGSSSSPVIQDSLDQPMEDIEDDGDTFDSNEVMSSAPLPTTVPTNRPLPTTQSSKIPVTTSGVNAQSTNNSQIINPDILRAADNVPPTIEQVPLGTLSPLTIQKFVKLIDSVRQEYVRPVNDEALFENAMTGVLSGLDPYSEYLNPEAYKNLRLFTEGDMGSIGVKVKFDNTSQQWVFSEVIKNSPAAKAGIQVGDYLHQINDNKLLDSQTQQDVSQLLSGIAGTQVKLIVSNQGRRKHNIILQRSLVQPQAIESQIINGIAVVHIPIFQSNTQQQLLNALTKINRPFNAMILDLRNNPGGVLTAANDIASLFMQDKNVVQVHNRQGIQEIIKTHPTVARLANLPLLVLQNRYSASASEVLASSLQENGRAKIFGETSYGKGSIQSVVPLMANDAIKITVAHYYSGQGKKIDGIGVIPDMHLTGGELTWEDQAINYMMLQPRPTRYIMKN